MRFHGGGGDDCLWCIGFDGHGICQLRFPMPGESRELISQTAVSGSRLPVMNAENAHEFAFPVATVEVNDNSNTAADVPQSREVRCSPPFPDPRDQLHTATQLS